MIFQKFQHRPSIYGSKVGEVFFQILVGVDGWAVAVVSHVIEGVVAQRVAITYQSQNP